MDKLVKILVRCSLLAYLLTGLCASAQTNTTASNAIGATSVAPTLPQIRMGLLLPLGSPILAPAAEAVRAGFLAAHERDGAGVKIRIYSNGEQPQDVLQAYADAAIEYDIVIGPLSREDVATIAESGKISKPTIALAQLENTDDDEVIFPQKMLMIGYSAEDEARQVAAWASSGRKTGQAWIITTNVSWQKRAAKAFAEEWQKHGLDLQTIELPTVKGYLGLSTLTQLKIRLQAEKPTLAFLALDADQAQQLRLTAGGDTLMYGTSQINGQTLSDVPSAKPPIEMNGVRLVDIPWQLQPDNLAVMSYPLMPLKEKQKRRANLERLYALGIDAYRVAKEIAMQKNNFVLDGVTGTLTISFGKDAPSFKRVEQQAVYRQGIWMPIEANK